MRLVETVGPAGGIGAAAANAPIQPDPLEISALQWVDQAQLAARLQSDEINPWFAMILERVRWAREAV
jgi:isopentenyldiphosphate isomerase